LTRSSMRALRRDHRISAPFPYTTLFRSPPCGSFFLEQRYDGSAPESIGKTPFPIKKTTKMHDAAPGGPWGQRCVRSSGGGSAGPAALEAGGLGPLQRFADPQQLAHAPGLGKAPAGGPRRAAVVDLGQVAQAAFPQGGGQGFQVLADPGAAGFVKAAQPQLGQVIAPQREGPDRTLMVGHVPHLLGPAVDGVEVGVGGVEGAQAAGGPQGAADAAD